MEWKLSAGETVGVVGIGVGLAWLTDTVAKKTTKKKRNRRRAMIAGGTALYTAGVVIGANRPPEGFLKGGY